MAIMATDGVVYEQKTFPTEQSALDLDVNGLSDRDEANLDFDTTAPPKEVDDSPSNNLTSSSLPLNGTSDNMNAFTSNQIALAPSDDALAIDLPTKSQSVEPSSTLNETRTPSQDHNTSTMTSLASQISPDAQDLSMAGSIESEASLATAIDTATETVIASAIEDISAPSTVLPVVEAQESDIRATTSPLALLPADQPQIQQVDAPAEPLSEAMHGGSANPETSHLATDSAAVSLPAEALATNGATMHTDSHPAASAQELNDAEMADVPESVLPAKVAREREDDDEAEPSAKRTKVEDDASMLDAPPHDSDAPEIPAANESVVPPSSGTAATAITTHEVKEIVKILKNSARTNHGKNFRLPVVELWPVLTADYLAKVSQPVDLATMENKLKDNIYATMDDFKADVNLLVANALTFNGAFHVVTKSATIVRDSILNKVQNLPAEPIVVPKAAKPKARQTTPRDDNAPRTTPTRRQAKPAPPAGPPAPTFALDPTTHTPLIRRDSTKNDAGRPKREIHPPKNKDLPYNATRPKNKKVATELKFVDHVLADMKKPKHSGYNHPFLVPVDPVSLGIPAYFQIIKNPMDMRTMEEKSQKGMYQSAKQFEADVKLMFSNCYKFNPVGTGVHALGKQFEAVFNELWANKTQWIADHTPAARTPSSNGGSDDEESEEEEEVEDPAVEATALAALSERLNEEQEKLINLMTAKTKDQNMIDMQKDMIDLIKGKIVATKSKPAAVKKAKKPKAARAPKKQVPVKKAGNTKKATKREKYMGTHEKNVISIGIQYLPEGVTNDVLAMIKAETDVDAGDDGEVELDIDAVTVPTLWKIHSLIMTHAPHVEQEARAILDKEEEKTRPAAPAKPPQRKKNKPMSKGEQERNIELLQRTMDKFERQSSGSQEPAPLPTIEHAKSEDSSDDEDDSDSEED